MFITIPPSGFTSDLTVNGDMDFLNLYQVKNLASPASGEALRKGNKDITNAEVSNSAAIAGSKLDLALYITNTMVSNSAAIALSKLASLPLTLTIAETEVYAGDTPNPSAWTDLDLSATIGAQATFVWLKFTCTEVFSAVGRIAVRKNGDTDPLYITDNVPLGCSSGELLLNSGNSIILATATDASGVIEWKAEGTEVAVTIDVIAYVG